MLQHLVNEYRNISYKRNYLLLRAIICYIRRPTFRVTVLIRWFVSQKNSFIRKLIHNKLLIKYGVEIGNNCTLGKCFSIKHYNGIVIGMNAIIGDNFTIYNQVTIGQIDGNYPKIGDNVTIFPGARVLGKITVGNNSIIAANAVVIKDVQENEIVGGVPAKVISMVGDNDVKAKKKYNL